MTEKSPIKCPVCESDTWVADLPNHDVRVCTSCKEIIHVMPDGTLRPIGQFLKRHELGDDQVRAAISAPHITTVKSFLDIFDSAEQQREFAIAHAKGGLRQVLAQVENRIEFAISKLSGLDLVFDAAGEVLAALRDARELVSTTTTRTRGIASKETASAESSE